ncbi:hypothetical protein [Streptomyces solaniscabiei]|uniref:hypothetical protein n=1 Tax=Streptomyces solaniscabiei TaxID=2683255 RepID=UPI001CE36D82|nr:hypothetical protein [Streptomyces solaniscabiei]
MTDLRQQVLREVTGRGIDAGEGGDVLPIEGSLAGRAFVSGLFVSAVEEAHSRWWVPVLDGTERLGVLSVAPGDGADVELVQALASVVGLLLVSKRPHSDAAARLARTEKMNLAAELQWNLVLPRSPTTRW